MNEEQLLLKGVDLPAIQSISTQPKKTIDYDEMKLYSSSYFS